MYDKEDSPDRMTQICRTFAESDSQESQRIIVSVIISTMYKVGAINLSFLNEEGMTKYEDKRDSFESSDIDNIRQIFVSPMIWPALSISRKNPEGQFI
ncbi:MAG: hypothetical protein RIC87_05955 [Kiloniellales bacterium]